MSITRSLHHNADSNPTGVSTRFGNRVNSWKVTRDRVASMAKGLIEYGLQSGDRVAIFSSNSDLNFELLHAIAWAGAVFVPLNTRWSANELISAIIDCDASYLAVDKVSLQLGFSLAESVPRLRLIGIDCADRYVPDCAYFAQKLETIPDVRGEDTALCSIFYTGGTTGRSRGVMLTHGNHCFNSVALIAAASLGEGMHYLHAAPMFHIADALFVFAATMLGAEQTFIPAFDAKGVADTIAAVRVTDMLLVPTMIGILLEYQAEAHANLSSLKRLFYGGSPISESTLLRLVLTLPGCQPFQLYGQTESAPVISMLKPQNHSKVLNRLRSAGRPLPGVDVRVVDAADRDCKPGEVGEVIARGLNVMKGYWNDPASTESALRGGWLRTGDAGYLDAEGFIFITDRIKDMIISGGENVYSIEVENVLASFPGVRQCAVVGLPDERWGERVHAILVMDQTPPGEEMIIQYCAERLARFKIPKSFTFRSERLPLSGAGKVLKTALRQELKQGNVAK